MIGSFLAGVGGNLAGLMLYPKNHLGLGASGMVMGALGLLAAQWLTLLRNGLTPRQLAVRGVLSACFLLVLLGFSPRENVDVLAHVAGFVSGLGIGAVLALLPERMRQSTWFDNVALLAWVGLVGSAWWLAIQAA
jgi:membrane associated rhomboid family serine protease